MAVAAENLRVVEEGISSLHTYASIPMSLTVATRFRVDLLDNGLSGFSIQEEPVDPPYEKNYDDYDEERPTRWRQRWNISNWGVLAAYMGGQRVDGAVMAWNTAHVNMLEDRSDLTVLWDIRVYPRPEADRGRPCPLPAGRTLGPKPRLPLAEGRNTERQRPGMSLLRE